jgi:hypothetical protein
MIMTSSSELSIKFHRPHRTCILDPMLALSCYGVPLVTQLGTVMDLWVGKEFWHILENTRFYSQHPESLLLNRAMPDHTEYIASFSAQEIRKSLQEWAKLRQGMDLDGTKLFWLGDRLNESSLPQGLQSNTIQKYEILASSLENQIPRSSQTSEILTSLFSDTVALSASLSSSFILTRQYKINDNDSLLPEICLELESFGIPCQTVDIADKMMVIEQDYLRKLFVQVGLSKFLWAGLKFSILHLLVPSIAQSGRLIEQNIASQIVSDSEVDDFSKSNANLWVGSKCFLYQL